MENCSHLLNPNVFCFLHALKGWLHLNIYLSLGTYFNHSKFSSLLTFESHLIKFKTACILKYKFGRLDILISMEFCFSGLIKAKSVLFQDYSRNGHFSGLYKAKSGLFRSFFRPRGPCRYFIGKLYYQAILSRIN